MIWDDRQIVKAVAGYWTARSVRRFRAETTEPEPAASGVTQPRRRNAERHRQVPFPTHIAPPC